MPGYLPAPGANQAPNEFGSNTYQVQQYQINPNAFTNPVSTQSQVQGYNTGQQQLLTAAQGAAPTVGPAATSAGAGTTGQLGVANTLAGIGTGAIPGAAQTAAGLAATNNQAANLSSMGSARGTANPALANYNLATANAANQQAAAQNAIIGASSQQLGALQGAGTAFSGVQQNQQFNATQIQQVAIQQATLQAQQLGLQGQELQNYIQNNAGQIASTMQAAQAGQSLQVQNSLGTQGLQSTAFNNAAGRSLGGDILNTLGSTVGSAGALATKFSDKRVKKNVKPGKESLDKFLSSIRRKK